VSSSLFYIPYLSPIVDDNRHYL